MNVTTVGIDLAKNVLQVHGVDERGKTVLRKQIKREQVIVNNSSNPSSRLAAATGSRSGSACLNNIPRFISGIRAGC